MSNQEHYSDEQFDLEKEPLERPATLSVDWGGDGTDLTRPVRAHVLAALQPHTGPYQPPLDALLTLGESDAETVDTFAKEHNIGQEHVPELVRMMRDRSLSTANSDDPLVFAPIHALHLLKSLNVTEVLPDLLPLLDLDFDLYLDEIGNLFSASGAAAIELVLTYLHDDTRWLWGRGQIIKILEEIALRYPETRERVIGILREMLADTDNVPMHVLTNAMGSLVEINALETLPLIRRAYELEKIDEMIYGPWGEVLKELGVEPEPDDPLVEESRKRFDQKHDDLFPPEMRQRLHEFQKQHEAQQRLAEQQAAAKKRKQEQARKQKNKQKSASAARKANRKKRK